MNIPDHKPAVRLAEQCVLLILEQAIESFDLEDLLSREGVSRIVQVDATDRDEIVAMGEASAATLAFVGLSSRTEDVTRALVARDIRVVAIVDDEMAEPTGGFATLVRPFSDSDVAHALRSLGVAI